MTEIIFFKNIRKQELEEEPWLQCRGAGPISSADEARINLLPASDFIQILTPVTDVQLIDLML